MKFAKTRTFSASVKMLTFLVAAALSGCSAEVGDQPEDGLLEDVSEESIPGDLSDKAGDSYVQWCNEPPTNGRNYGTICRQQNCENYNCYLRESLAIAECRDEVRRLCGNAVHPWYIMLKWDGLWRQLR